MDLVVLDHGKPVVIVEAKSRPIVASFRHAVLDQLRWYASRTGSRWTLLADPDVVQIFEGSEIRPWAEVPAAEVLDAAGLSGTTDIGKHTLIVAIERWLRRLRELPPGEVADNPSISGLASTLREADEVATEYAVA